MRKLILSLVLVSLFSGCLFYERAPTIYEVLGAIERVDEYQYQAHISEIEDSELMLTQTIRGGMSLETSEGFEEWRTYSPNGELREIYRVAVFGGRYHNYRFRRDEKKVLENITTTTIGTKSNKTKTAFSIIELKLSYSYIFL